MTGIADTIRRAGEEVEQFRGDYEELAAVMRDSWADGPSIPYLYTADLLGEWLAYPGTPVTPAIYSDGRLVAFAAGLPRRVEIAGAIRRILISTFLTVAPAQKASGYGIVVWSELMRRAAAAGYDGVINYCVDGQAMHRMIETGCRLLDLPLTRVKSFSYLVGVLTPGQRSGGGSGARPATQRLVQAGAGEAERGDGDARARLWRAWSEAEAEWQLSRGGAIAVSDGEAILTGTVVTVADAAGSRYLVVDDVLWASASSQTRQRLLADLLARAADDGARYVGLPLMGYADARPFLAAGLVPAPHTMHAYLTLWSDPAAVQPVDRYYLDVI